MRRVLGLRRARWLAILPIPILGLIFAVGALGRSAAPRRSAAIPSPSADSFLHGVDCVGSSDCWAVGYDIDTSGVQLNQVLHWNGAHWSQATVPQPAGTASNDVNSLNAVSCLKASNCWAVGSDGLGGGGAQLNEVLHWNGSKWSAVTTPQPGGYAMGSINNLDAVDCRSASNCWAVGVHAKPDQGFENQTLHWNGHKWALVPSPNPGGTSKYAFNILEALSCHSASPCFAAGDFETSTYFNQALRWTGTRWLRAKTPQPGSTFGSNLTSLSCGAAGDCWAVGDYNTSTGALNQALHFNGTKWTRGTTPQPGGTTLNSLAGLTGVSCDAAKHCWAVGYFETANGPNQNEALRWNGSKWSSVSVPNPGGDMTGDSNQLQGVSCVSASYCWAVGFYSTGTATFNMAVHWNGSKWSAG